MAEVAEIKEVQEQKVNPFEYVTIPISEYRELVTVTAKKKAKKEYKKLLAEAKRDSDTHWRWYKEQKAKVEELRKNLDDAKALIAKKLGVDPDEFLAKKGETDKETEKLADLQFEKGVKTDAESV